MMTRAALMAAVTAVAAQIAIPLPFSPVPFTLQVLAVILSGLLLGPRYGALAQVVYVLVGAVGVPVFSGFSGGLRYSRSYGGVSDLLPHRRRRRGARHPRGGRHCPSPGALFRLLVGMRGSRRHLRSRGHLA